MKEEKNQHHSQTEQEMPTAKKDKGKMVWMIIAIIAIIALIGSVAYGYMSMKNLDKKISDQQAQINDLSNTKKTLEDAASAAATAATEAAAKAVGNAITGSSDNESITAAATNYARAINVSTKSAQVKVIKISEGYSWVQVTPSSGSQYNLLLKKQSNNWVVVYEGKTPPSSEMLKQYGAPANIAE